VESCQVRQRERPRYPGNAPGTSPAVPLPRRRLPAGTVHRLPRRPRGPLGGRARARLPGWVCGRAGRSGPPREV